MKTVVMIPTYNERDNLSRLIGILRDLQLQDCFFLIIDDNSPDGTGKLADALAEKDAAVRVLHRKSKEGLGRAYVEGFKYAIGELRADLVFTMDADLSHDPHMIPKMIIASETADVVVGSRYVEGGKIENWSMFRKMVSAFGNLYARIVLAMPVKDLTTGFMCFRRRVIESIGLETLVANGYVFLIELKYYSFTKGYVVREVPITFVERREGLSKFNFSIFYEAFVSVIALRIRRRFFVKNENRSA